MSNLGILNSAADRGVAASTQVPSTYGYGPRPGDPLAVGDKPSLSGELGLTDSTLSELLSEIGLLEDRVVDLMVGADSNEAYPAPPPPPLPEGLARIRGQRHQLYNAIERVRELNRRLAL